MATRREFLKTGAATAMWLANGAMAADVPGAANAGATSHSVGDLERRFWVEIAEKLANPVLGALADKRLRRSMPIEAADPSKRQDYTHLEALGRLLCGLAPWLELGGDDTDEGKLRGRLAEQARRGLDAATDPQSPDFMNFARGGQPLVDAAFLAQAFLRAPNELWRKLDRRVQRNVVTALLATRRIQAPESNWKLFATMVEVWLQRAGEPRDDVRLLEGIQKHERWYVGDGTYGDGPQFHWDYYNSFVIQPMLVEALDVVGDETPALTSLRTTARERLTRWAAIQERMITNDGSFPVLGRSVAYRCGAFHGLALAALRNALPVNPGCARVALSRVIRRTMTPPGTWDAGGWLQIGLAGHQPQLAEPYISTGSLYLCSVALLPLGLPISHRFWSDPPEKTTWERAWSGEDLPADKALKA